jgi:putative transposase
MVIPLQLKGFEVRIFSAQIDEEIFMRKSRFSETQIMGILRQAEGGLAVADLCREHAISSATFYKWRSKYGGMDASMISEMKGIEDENRRLKKMYAELSMQNELLKEALGKK